MKPTGDCSMKKQQISERLGGNSEEKNHCHISQDFSAMESSRVLYTNSENNHNNSYNNNHNNNSSNPNPVSLFNLIFYVLCISALGFSLYANLRQIHNEDKLRHLRHLDDRISILESKMQQLMTIRRPSLQASIQSSSPADPQNEAATGFTATADFSDVASVVRKLSLQVQGMQRLRRDVSHLQMTRRQASIQSEQECMCPAGKLVFLE